MYYCDTVIFQISALQCIFTTPQPCFHSPEEQSSQPENYITDQQMLEALKPQTSASWGFGSHSGNGYLTGWDEMKLQKALVVFTKAMVFPVYFCP